MDVLLYGFELIHFKKCEKLNDSSNNRDGYLVYGEELKTKATTVVAFTWI